MSLYDIYPEIRGEHLGDELPEFAQTLVRPNQEDVNRFANVALQFIQQHSLSDLPPNNEGRCHKMASVMIPSGVIVVGLTTQASLSAPEKAYRVPLTIEALLSIAHALDDISSDRLIGIDLDYSKKQQEEYLRRFVRHDHNADSGPKPKAEDIHRRVPFTTRPVLLDYGVQHGSEASDTFLDMIELRADQVADTLPIQPGTFTEDPAVANMLGNAVEIFGELSLDAETNPHSESYLQELADPDRPFRSAPVSRRTLRRLTKLLADHARPD